jgi:predicted DNA-binding protein (UPF0251 family)
MHQLKQVVLTVDELESMRLKDIEGLDQEEAAKMMKVSRTTFGRTLILARAKVTGALILGKAIKINGGDYIVEERGPSCKTKKIES